MLNVNLADLIRTNDSGGITLTNRVKLLTFEMRNGLYWRNGEVSTSTLLPNEIYSIQNQLVWVRPDRSSNCCTVEVI